MIGKGLRGVFILGWVWAYTKELESIVLYTFIVSYQLPLIVIFWVIGLIVSLLDHLLQLLLLHISNLYKLCTSHCDQTSKESM